jgi:hypothetical protein
MQKKSVGRPRKKSKNAVVLDVEKNKTIEFDWKAAYLNLAKADAERDERFTAFKENASNVIGEMADNQLNVINVVLDAVDSIEEHCTNVLVQTNSLEMSDVSYMVNLAKRRLLATYSQMQNDSEEV